MLAKLKRDVGTQYPTSPTLFLLGGASDNVGFGIVNLDSQSVGRALSTVAIYDALNAARSEASGFGFATMDRLADLEETTKLEGSKLPGRFREDLQGLKEIVHGDYVRLGLPFRIVYHTHHARVAALYKGGEFYRQQLTKTINLLDEMKGQIQGMQGVEKVKEILGRECEIILNTESDTFRTAVAKLFAKNMEGEYAGVKCLRFLEMPPNAKYSPAFSKEANPSIANKLDIYWQGQITDYSTIARLMQKEHLPGSNR